MGDRLVRYGPYATPGERRTLLQTQPLPRAGRALAAYHQLAVTTGKPRAESSAESRLLHNVLLPWPPPLPPPSRIPPTTTTPTPTGWAWMAAGAAPQAARQPHPEALP